MRGSVAVLAGNLVSGISSVANRLLPLAYLAYNLTRAGGALASVFHAKQLPLPIRADPSSKSLHG